MHKYIIILVFLVCGCATVQSDWESAEKIGTIQGYEEFLKKHSEGEFSFIAMRKIIKLSFEESKAKDDIETYRYFLTKYPDNEFAIYAKKRIEELEYETAIENDTITIYEKYIENYPNSVHVSDFKNKIEEIEYKYAVEKDVVHLYENFINKYPNSVHISDFNNRIEELEYKLAIKINTAHSYEYYINKYPNSVHISDFTNKIEEKIYDECKTSKNTKNILNNCNKFLSKYPNSKFAADANERLKKIDEYTAKIIDSEGYILRFDNKDGVVKNDYQSYKYVAKLKATIGDHNNNIKRLDAKINKEFGHQMFNASTFRSITSAISTGGDKENILSLELSPNQYDDYFRLEKGSFGEDLYNEKSIKTVSPIKIESPCLFKPWLNDVEIFKADNTIVFLTLEVTQLGDLSLLIEVLGLYSHEKKFKIYHQSPYFTNEILLEGEITFPKDVWITLFKNDVECMDGGIIIDAKGISLMPGTKVLRK